MRVRALTRMLLRDLWSMKGQGLAIAMVIGSGVATFVLSLSTLDSLRLTRSTYYRDYSFADVFASLKRAPESLEQRLQSIPGVTTVQTRVLAAANLEVPGFQEPINGQILSLPDDSPPRLNGVFIREGRFPEPGRENEVLVSEAFAEAHQFRPGDHLFAVINGRRERLRIVGLALSPEFIYQLSPGSIIPDFKRFGVLWMRRQALAVAYNMEGAFNSVTLALERQASLPDVLAAVDQLLERYGGLGSYARKDQISHKYLDSEFQQLGQMSRVFPTIFLGVAAFLLNVVISRLITTQREQIAVLKAFGYSNVAVGFHYLKLVLVVVLVGTIGGVIAGGYLGRAMAAMYMEFYKFPYLHYWLDPGIALLGGGITAAASVMGTLFAVRKAALLPPAEAMRPEPPATFRETLIERLGIKRWLAQPSRMILRHLERRPLKTLLSILGLACAYSILMVGSFFEDAFDHMVRVQYELSQREDVSVAFIEPTSRRALHELEQLPGVHRAEPWRSVAVRLRYQHRSYRTSLMAVESETTLFQLLDSELQPVPPPTEGVLLSTQLAKILGVLPGDSISIEVLEGSRPRRTVLVASTVEQFIGLGAYMELHSVNRLLGEGSAISGAYLDVDERALDSIHRELERRPRVVSSVSRGVVVQNFYDIMARQTLVFAFFMIVLAGTIAFGVVYNSARIALSERSRELASLRVLGFTRGEISYILLGELAVLTIAAAPVGFFLGHLLCQYMVASLPQELFRIPLIVDPSTYAFAATVVIGSALISGLIVRRKLDHLDLIAVLKSKE